MPGSCHSFALSISSFVPILALHFSPRFLLFRLGYDGTVLMTTERQVWCSQGRNPQSATFRRGTRERGRRGESDEERSIISTDGLEQAPPGEGGILPGKPFASSAKRLVHQFKKKSDREGEGLVSTVKEVFKSQMGKGRSMLMGLREGDSETQSSGVEGEREWMLGRATGGVWEGHCSPKDSPLCDDLGRPVGRVEGQVSAKGTPQAHQRQQKQQRPQVYWNKLWVFRIAVFYSTAFYSHLHVSYRSISLHLGRLLILFPISEEPWK